MGGERRGRAAGWTRVNRGSLCLFVHQTREVTLSRHQGPEVKVPHWQPQDPVPKMLPIANAAIKRIITWVGLPVPCSKLHSLVISALEEGPQGADPRLLCRLRGLGVRSPGLGHPRPLPSALPPRNAPGASCVITLCAAGKP